jgi:hypothetical protein
MMNSFFSTLIAYSCFVLLVSASMTFPKLPFPRTARKLKWSSPIRRPVPCQFAGGVSLFAGALAGMTCFAGGCCGGCCGWTCGCRGCGCG